MPFYSYQWASLTRPRKKFVSSEVGRLQGLLQENRQEGDILYGLHTEEEMLANIEKLIKGGMDETTHSKFWRSMAISPFIAENLHRGAESSLSHLVTLPATADRIQEEVDSEKMMTLLRQQEDAFAAQLEEAKAEVEARIVVRMREEQVRLG